MVPFQIEKKSQELAKHLHVLNNIIRDLCKKYNCRCFIHGGYLQKCILVESGNGSKIKNEIYNELKVEIENKAPKQLEIRPIYDGTQMQISILLNCIDTFLISDNKESLN